ncbi:MAG: universal stress protein [Burkholderiales bacterium]|nr:universal stress protein [Burkholderiales bacterium]
MFRIVVAVDGSAPAERALAHALRLAALGVPLEVLLVNVEPEVHAGEVGPAVSAATVERMRRQAGEAALAPSLTKLERAGVRGRAEVRFGPPAEAIVAAAREELCDAIFIGTRGRGAVAAALGSVAAEVVRLADVPVTVVK